MDVRKRVENGGDARVPPVASEIGVPAGTIYAKIAKGEIKARRLGRIVILPNSEARRLLGLVEAMA